MNSKITAGENKVFNFMEQVALKKEMSEQDLAFQNSPEYKQKCLDDGKEQAKACCLDKVFASIYKDALPLNNDYKVACSDDLNADIHDYMNNQCPQGMVYYVKDAARTSPVMAKLEASIDNIVDDAYADRQDNLQNYDANDMAFQMDDSTLKKIDAVSKDLSMDDISSVINDNVKATAIAEINRAKKEKEAQQQVETDLANDMSVTSQEAIESALELRGINEKKDFQPSLFEGIMIGNTAKFVNMESSNTYLPEYLYDAMSEYTEKTDSDEVHLSTPVESAFIESVKEYTKLNMLKALKLKSFSLTQIRDLAQEYAEVK